MTNVQDRADLPRFVGRSGAEKARRAVRGRYLLGLLALKLVLLFVLAVNSRFDGDELFQLSNARYLGPALYDTFWPIKAVGYAIFYQLAHWLADSATSIALTARLQTALLAAFTMTVLYGIARNIGQDRVQALFALCVLVCFSTFMERAFRVRAEPVALFFAAAALFAATRPAATRTHLIVAGILTGAAFLSTQKAIYFNVALGVAVTAEALFRRKPMIALERGALILAGWAVAVAVYGFVLGNDNAVAVWQHLILAPRTLALEGGGYYQGLQSFIGQTLQRNTIPYGLALVGIAVALRHAGTPSTGARIALIFTLFTAAFVFAHSQPWPHVFIMAIPFLALWSGELMDPRKVPSLRPAVPLFALFVAAALSFWRNFDYLDHDNAKQLDLIARAESIVERDEVYLDGLGMIVSRRSAGRAWWDWPAMRRILNAEDDEAAREIEALFAEEPKLVIVSYRSRRLAPVLADRLLAGYVPIGANLLLAGAEVGPAGRAFRPAWSGRWRVYDADGLPSASAVLIDGRLMRGAFGLSAGRYWIEPEEAKAGEPVYLLPDGLPASVLQRRTEADSALFEGVYTD